MDEGAQKIVDGWSAQNDRGVKKGLDAITTARSIGRVDRSLGLLDRSARKRAIQERSGSGEYMSTGMPEVDVGLDGGLMRGCVGLTIGGTGDGKSMDLNQKAAVGASTGHFVVMASVENKPALFCERFDAALFGIPSRVIRANPNVTDKLYARFEDSIGIFVPKFFKRLKPGDKTPLCEIFDWVHALADHFKRFPDVLILDYIDRLGRSDGETQGDYLDGEVLMDELVDFTEHHGLWTWTASQPQRKKPGHRLWTKDDVAGSMHKSRRVDTIYTLNVERNEFGDKVMTVLCDKNREGDSGAIVGPLPVGFDKGRVFDNVVILDMPDESHGPRRKRRKGP
jgi:hypothetical protein